MVRVARVRWFLVLALLFVLALSFMAVGAQTPEPLTTTVILDGAESLIGSYGLTALILVGAFVGLAFMIIRRFKRAAS